MTQSRTSECFLLVASQRRAEVSPFKDDMRESFELILNSECGLARSGPCMFSIWRGRPDVNNVKVHFELADQLLRDHSKFGVMLVIAAGARPPSVAGFRAIEDFYGHYASRIGCLAQVLEATGFASSAARSAMSLILSRKLFPAKVFAKTSEAIPWCASLLAPTPAGLQSTGMMLASHLQRARLAYTWQPKNSLARNSVLPEARGR